MADELPAGSMNMEEEAAPVAVAAPTPEVPPEAPPETPPSSDPNQPAAVESVEVAGKHYIPVAAVQDERAKRQAAESRAAELQAQIQQNEPILALLRNNPGLLQRPEPVPTAQPNPAEDPDALEAAKLLDFYTPEGKPDGARGAAHLRLVQKQAETIAQRTMSPLAQQSQQERANANYQRALNIKDPAGNPINPQTLRAVWAQVQSDVNGTNILADPQAAAFVAAAALGVQTLTSQPVIAPPAQRPIVTEASGGGGGRRAAITELESKVAAERGRNAEQWAAVTKGHIAGRPNTIEE